ncbi:MAG: 4Fe-4S binding protein [Leptospiraceae bacterium]|nr:4Fe-4S binding protein [Leptospiraceae bacterium]MDW7976829.1 4Fe-4S binding protein [Leptospiraceae bacterium]
MDRKEFFKNGFKELVKEFYQTPIGSFIDSQLQSIVNALEPLAFYTIQEQDQEKQKEKKKTLFIRPPGAVSDPKTFLSLCTSCGDCIISCKNYAIFRIPEIEGPVMNPNYKACLLCEDYPCISACDTKALRPLEEGALPYFGFAKVKEEKCLNFPLKNTKKRKLNCNLCYEHCPIEDAISLKNKVPEIQSSCVGCGICKSKCPTNAFEIVLE